MPFQLNSLMIARYIGNAGHWWCGCNDVLIDLMGASCNVIADLGITKAEGDQV